LCNAAIDRIRQSLFILNDRAGIVRAFRRLCEQYHAKAEGPAAGAALDRLLDAKRLIARLSDPMAAVSTHRAPPPGVSAIELQP
jgi:hypothetical protein